jgi:hypothetical protein
MILSSSKHTFLHNIPPNVSFYKQTPLGRFNILTNKIHNSSVLYLTPGNEGPKNSYVNPYDSEMVVEALPIFNHAMAADLVAGEIPARDNDELQLYFSTPCVNNKKWVQFHGKETRLFSQNDKEDFKLLIGSFCDPEKQKTFKSIHYSDQEPLPEQTKRMSDYQIIVGDGASQQKAHAEAILTHETDDDDNRQTVEGSTPLTGKEKDKVEKKKARIGVEMPPAEAEDEQSNKGISDMVTENYYHPQKGDDKNKKAQKDEVEKTAESAPAPTAEEQHHGEEGAVLEKKKKKRPPESAETGENANGEPGPTTEEHHGEDGAPVEKKKKKRRPKIGEEEKEDHEEAVAETHILLNFD